MESGITYRRLIPLITAAAVFSAGQLRAAPTELVDEQPVAISKLNGGVHLVDFGKVAFGNIRLLPPEGADGEIVVHFGEDFRNGRINRQPPGTVRYNLATLQIRGGEETVAAPPADQRNTEPQTDRHPPAILTPPEWGVVLPFRWVEIENWPGDLRPEQVVRQAGYLAGWDDAAASFESSDELLNRIWELCRYSIKATTFAGVYVDGDRERIPYEADAYLNQISHYYTDHDKQMARDTIDHLFSYPTWPTEWAPHMVFMVYADYMWTGDRQWLSGRYEILKGKTLIERRKDNGLVISDEEQIRRTDIVDWPKGERDGFEFTTYNTVVNAFHLRALTLMGRIARIVGLNTEALEYERMVKQSPFHESFFDPVTGLYTDGMESDHSSLHANLFPLAFGLVPEQHRTRIAGWLADRGMACSVYVAQYLMEALFENGADSEALSLMMAEGDRSWRHMVESGATITWEAWDHKYKPNQDWNHAWGAAPANLLPRYILGVEPGSPGWGVALVRPRTGGLSHAKGKVPTPRGPIHVAWEKSSTFKMNVVLPKGISARVEVPDISGTSVVLVNGEPADAWPENGRWVIEAEVSGSTTVELR